MPPASEIRILKSPEDLFEAAATQFIAQASEAIRARGKFTVALSGGSTPKRLYSLLATKSAIPWDKIYFFWGDERHVPPDDAESNYRMANEALLSKVPVPAGNVFRIHSEEKDANIAASQYEQTLQQFFQVPPGDFPRFDLIYLGLGPDGHAASLFPDSAALNERRRWVVANWVEKFKTDRITFTFPVLNAAACVVFLASGPDKAAIVHQVLENPAANLPSQLIRPVNGKLLWLLDSAAASALAPSSKS